MIFDSRPNKYEKEQEKLREAAKKRRENEMKLQKAQLQREKELLEIAEKRRIEKELIEQEKLLEEENERHLTGGIKFSVSLELYEIEGEDDKIILPESCLTDLSNQDAFGKGPATFQIKLATNESSKTTHCGVREFSALEGKVGIPRKVLDSLVVDGSLKQSSMVSIKFVKLSKVTFVKLQPKQNKFFDVGPVKQCLEENLRFHSTLTVGDQLTVWYRGAAHPLVVVELRPEAQGNMFDTDVEVDLELSEEYLDHQKKTSSKTTSQTTFSSSASTTASTSTSSGKPTFFPASTSIFRTLVGGSDTAAAESDESKIPTSINADQMVKYDEILLPEPDAAVVGVIRVKIRLTNGITVLRRFDVDSPASQVFYYIGSELCLTRDQLENVQVTSKTLNRTFRLCDAEMQNGTTSFKQLGLIDSTMVLMMAILQ